MGTPWTATVRQVADGQPVSAAVTNRPTGDLAARTEYLKARMDAIEDGQAFVLRARPLGSDLAVGMPLYIDENGVWQAAKAEWSLGSITEVKATAAVAGVLYALTSANLGDILVLGKFEMTDAELAAISDGTVSAGPVYLSASTSGFLTSTAPSPGILVGTVAPSGSGTNLLYVVQSVRPAISNLGEMVTSLEAADGSVAVTDASTGLPATTGALKVSANLSASVADVAGQDQVGMAVKGYDAANRVLQRGAVVAGIRSATDELIVSGTKTVTVSDTPYAGGLVTISVGTYDANRDGSAQLVALSGVTEEMYNDSVPYLAFVAGRPSSLRCRVATTPYIGSGTAALTISFWLFRPGAAPDATMEFSYLVVPRPGSSEIELSTTESAATPIVVDLSSSGGYNIFTSPEIVINSGDIVLFTLARTDTNDGGDLGLLNIAYNYTLQGSSS